MLKNHYNDMHSISRYPVVVSKITQLHYRILLLDSQLLFLFNLALIHRRSQLTIRMINCQNCQRYVSNKAYTDIGKMGLRIFDSKSNCR